MTASEVLTGLQVTEDSIRLLLKPLAAESRVLQLLNEALRELDTPSQQALDRALGKIEIADKAAAESAIAAQSVRGSLAAARQLVSNATMDAHFTDFAGLRERLYHECVHPVARTTLLNIVAARMVEEKLDEMRGIAENVVTGSLRDAAAAGAESHP